MLAIIIVILYSELYNIWFTCYLKDQIEHPVLRELLQPILELYENVRRKALMRLEYEGLKKAEAIETPGARFYHDPSGFAMERYAYYVCYKCFKVYNVFLDLSSV